MTPKEIKKLNLIKIRNFCVIKQVKRQHTEWGKILANQISDKGLVSRCIKNSYNSSIKTK